MSPRARRCLAACVIVVLILVWRFGAGAIHETTDAGPAAGRASPPAGLAQNDARIHTRPTPMMAVAAAPSAAKNATSDAPADSRGIAAPDDMPRDGSATNSAASIEPSLLREHRVAAGQTLKKIAALYRVTPEFLASLNGLHDVNRVRIGSTLKVVQGPFRAIVEKRAFTMDVFLGTTLVHRFRVGLGSNGNTPTGVWRVANKLQNPSWVNPKTHERYAADDPTNPIGEHWLGLDGLTGEAIGKEGFGIHATIVPDSIGKNASLGCVRLSPDDAALVFSWLVEGASTVEIR